MTVTMAPTLMMLPAMSGQHAVVSATTTDAKGHKRCLFSLATVAAAAASVLDPSSGPCQLCHGSSSGKFLFQS